jgi:FkbH-like protein
MPELREKTPKIKCLAWDLDNTLWRGVLLEDNNVALRDGVVETIQALDARGVLHSICSKNHPDQAMAKLKELGVEQYFLYPQISWNPKSSGIIALGDALNIGLDTIALIDDEPYERAEVQYKLPQVRCFDAEDLAHLPKHQDLTPRFVTQDSANRRLMYRAEIDRQKAKSDSEQPDAEFLATLDMVFSISAATHSDLRRAEELTVRTNQMNTTAITFSYDELERLRSSPDHRLLMAELDDKFGAYGKVGLALIECREDLWTIKLFLMSCRVVSRGVGAVLLNHIIREALRHKVRLQADFVRTKRNRMMHVAYRFAGFRVVGSDGDRLLFEWNGSQEPSFPTHTKVVIAE